MTNTLKRRSGDTTPVYVVLGESTHANLEDVVSVALNVYDDGALTILVETLAGERRGFAPGIFFPVVDGAWTGTRYAVLALTYSNGEVLPISDKITWRQE